jgi:hypothetical protein
MSVNVILTSGEYDDFSIDAAVGVPSLRWLRQRMLEYKAMVDAADEDERWMDGWGSGPHFAEWLVENFVGELTLDAVHQIDLGSSYDGGFVVPDFKVEDNPEATP